MKTEIQQHVFVAFGSFNRSCIEKRLLDLGVAIVKLLMPLRLEKKAETPAHVSAMCKLITSLSG